jgi:hypothetical protein
MYSTVNSIFHISIRIGEGLLRIHKVRVYVWKVWKAGLRKVTRLFVPRPIGELSPALYQLNAGLPCLEHWYT